MFYAIKESDKMSTSGGGRCRQRFKIRVSRESRIEKLKAQSLQQKRCTHKHTHTHAHLHVTAQLWFQFQLPLSPGPPFSILYISITALNVARTGGKYDKFRWSKKKYVHIFMYLYLYLCICVFVSYKTKSEAHAHQYRSSGSQAECRLSLSLCVCVCVCLCVLLWHKPIKPRLIGHVKWRNRARTQVWHFIIISTVRIGLRDSFLVWWSINRFSLFLTLSSSLSLSVYSCLL